MDEKEKQCIEECRDHKVEKGQLSYLFYVIGATALITLFSLYASPHYFASVDDKDGLYRYILITVPKAMMAMTVLFSSSVLIDFIIPGDLLKKITENSIACAIYSGLLLIGVAIAM